MSGNSNDDNDEDIAMLAQKNHVRKLQQQYNEKNPLKPAVTFLALEANS
jgi:hypothetical protein